MKYRAALFSSAFCLVFVSVFFVGRFVWADDYGLKATADAAELPQETSVPTIIGNVIGAGLSLVTVLFFILMIYAGIKWMLARGDEGKAKEALDTIVAAIIGIVVVLAAYAITNFVFDSVGSGGGSGGGGKSGADTVPESGLVYCIIDNKCEPQSKDDEAGCGSNSMTYSTYDACDNVVNPKKWCINTAKTDCISFPASQDFSSGCLAGGTTHGNKDACVATISKTPPGACKINPTWQAYCTAQKVDAGGCKAGIDASYKCIKSGEDCVSQGSVGICAGTAQSQCGKGNQVGLGCIWE